MTDGAVLVAPDSFKGTFSAVQVAAAIGRGIAAAGLRADLCPVADGGEGTLEVVLAAIGGQARVATVQDPLGRPVQARWGLLSGGAVALVETAAASGLGLLHEQERDPWRASTYGTGEL